jgi:hypothetical protein
MLPDEDPVDNPYHFDEKKEKIDKSCAMCKDRLACNLGRKEFTCTKKEVKNE